MKTAANASCVVVSVFMVLMLVPSYLTANTSKLEVKIGLLMTSGRCCDFLSIEDKGSSLNIAIDNLHKDGVLDNNAVSFK